MIEFFNLVERVSSTVLWWDWRGIHRFIGLFTMNPQETHSKLYRRKGTLEFPRRTLAFCKLIWSTDSNDPDFFFCLVLIPQSERANYNRNAHWWRCSNKEAWKRLARRHSCNGPWTHECYFEVDVFVCWEWIEELEWLLLLRVCLSFFRWFQRPNLSTGLANDVNCLFLLD